MSTFSQENRTTLNHLAIYVKNLERSSAFYRNILQLDTLPEPFKDGLHAWFKIGPQLSLHIIQGAKEDVNQYRNTHTCFSVHDIDAFIQLLNKNNIEFEDSKGIKQAITTRVDGVKQIYFKDPDGYWLEINNDK